MFAHQSAFDLFVEPVAVKAGGEREWQTLKFSLQLIHRKEECQSQE